MGLLSSGDRRFHNVLLKSFEKEPQLCVGDNEPYIGTSPGNTIDKHAIIKERFNTLIEVRNDLIKTDFDQKAWAKLIKNNLIQAKEYLDGWRIKNKTWGSRLQGIKETFNGWTYRRAKYRSYEPSRVLSQLLI